MRAATGIGADALQSFTGCDLSQFRGTWSSCWGNYRSRLFYSFAAKDIRHNLIVRVSCWSDGTLQQIVKSSIYNLLFGEVSPRGKLRFTWPRNVGQVPMIYAHRTSHDPKNANKRYWNEAGGPAYRNARRVPSSRRPRRGVARSRRVKWRRWITLLLRL
jgi:hypothetical protein